MLLHDAFVALLISTDVSAFHDRNMTREDVDFAKKKAVSSYRFFADALKSEAYKQFLFHCEQTLEGAAQKPLVTVLFTYLVDVDPLLLSTVDISERLKPMFQQFLQHQDDVLSLAPLGRAFIHRPRAFAAFVRCLLLRGATPQDLLSTSLLQDFFRYYMSSLNESPNPIEQLYDLFHAFPETDLLSTLAKTVCCEEGGLVSYALDGSQPQEAGSLKVIPSVLLPLRFTLLDDNLHRLHTLFGVDFLLGALHQCSEKSNFEAWVHVLKPLFNQDSTVETQLPILLNRLQEHPALQSSLAHILSEETLMVLVERRVGGAFHLIPYCPKIVDSLVSQDLAVYLQNLQDQSSSGFALIACMLALFGGVNKSANESAGTLVFDAVLDALLANPCALDDAATIQKLHKFSRAKDCVVGKARALELTLDRIIQIQTDTTVAAMDYITIEDAWRQAALNIQRLQRIISFETACPVDKYKLYSRIYRSFLEHEAHIPLHAFASALGIDPTFDAAHATPYERLLVELLAAIDEPSLRMHCIQSLDTHVSRPWRTARYGELVLFQQGVITGNIGLIQWLEQEHVHCPDSYNLMAISAATAHQWAVVRYFYQQHKLNKGTLNTLLNHAVEQGQPNSIQMLFSDMNHSPDRDSIEQEFKLAVRQKDYASTLCFLRNSIKPCDTVMAKAFKQAILFDDSSIAYAILDANMEPFFQGVVDQVMLSAARENQCYVLSRLAILTQNAPTPRGVESALLHATRANQLEAVQSLMHWLPPPRQDAVQHAKVAANNLHDNTIKNYLSVLGEPCVRASKRRHSEKENIYGLQALDQRTRFSLRQHGLFKPVANACVLTPVELEPQNAL